MARRRTTYPGADDALFLSSTYLRYKVSQKYALKFRYLFRMNESSNSANDYMNHIVSAGVDVKY